MKVVDGTRMQLDLQVGQFISALGSGQSHKNINYCISQRTVLSSLLPTSAGVGGDGGELVAVNEGMDTHVRRICWASLQLKPESRVMGRSPFFLAEVHLCLCTEIFCSNFE